MVAWSCSKRRIYCKYTKFILLAWMQSAKDEQKNSVAEIIHVGCRACIASFSYSATLLFERANSWITRTISASSVFSPSLAHLGNSSELHCLLIQLLSHLQQFHSAKMIWDTLKVAPPRALGAGHLVPLACSSAGFLLPSILRWTACLQIRRPDHSKVLPLLAVAMFIRIKEIFKWWNA